MGYLLLCLPLLLSGCAWLGEEIDTTQGWSAQRLYSEAQGHMQQGNYDLAIELLEKLQARYPFGRFAQQAQHDLIYIYHRTNEPDSAIAAADRFIRTYPRHPFVDYAYYMKGVVNFNRGKMGIITRLFPGDPTKTDTKSLRQAFNDFDELVRKYPDSRYADDARQRMIYLRNTLAYHEINVADFYMRREAYLSAVNRASYVVNHYSSTPAAGDALSILTEAYYRLGQQDLAQDSYRVLALNYPDHKHMAALDDMLERGELPSRSGAGLFGMGIVPKVF